MRRHGARGALAGLAAGLLMVGVVGCGTPQPSVTPAPSPVAPSPAVTASTSPTPIVIADEPKIECDQNTSTWTRTDANGSQVPIIITLTCENAVAAAKTVVGPDPAVAYIEFAYGYFCPPNARCAMSQPNTGHVIFHTKGRRPDILVSVKADAAGKVTAFDQRPLPSPSG